MLAPTLSLKCLLLNQKNRCNYVNTSNNLCFYIFFSELVCINKWSHNRANNSPLQSRSQPESIPAVTNWRHCSCVFYRQVFPEICNRSSSVCRAGESVGSKGSRDQPERAFVLPTSTMADGPTVTRPLVVPCFTRLGVGSNLFRRVS